MCVRVCGTFGGKAKRQRAVQNHPGRRKEKYNYNYLLCDSFHSGYLRLCGSFVALSANESETKLSRALAINHLCSRPAHTQANKQTDSQYTAEKFIKVSYWVEPQKSVRL